MVLRQTLFTSARSAAKLDHKIYKRSNPVLYWQFSAAGQSVELALYSSIF